MKNKIIFIVFCLLSVNLIFSTALSEKAQIPEELNPLFIPQLIDSRTTDNIELDINSGKHEFFSGIESKTMGFNGDYLGPTIKLYRGSSTDIIYNNNMDEPTTVHSHGLHISGKIDGGPQNRINPGESWSITIPVQQEAGMSWYHPHLMGKTAEHVHAGLAGIYLIEDENSLSLNLPKEYGVNDIPLVVQDRSFTDGVMNKYEVDRRQLIDGLRDDTLIVNGTVDAFHKVPKGWVRLRLLNGSNSRFYRFKFDEKIPFYKIATEGGFLNEPVLMESTDMAPGERNEIMVDLSYSASVRLLAELLPVDPEDTNIFSRNEVKHVVELQVDQKLKPSGSLPEKLNNITYFDRNDATNFRSFRLMMDGNNRNKNSTDLKNMFSINGESMNMGIINDRVKKGEVEIWTITGERMPHPFHIHGASFQILTQNGELPAEADRGWKDTVIVWKETTEIIIRFDHEATDDFPFMYHCHMLEHEEAGMMGQFTVK